MKKKRFVVRLDGRWGFSLIAHRYLLLIVFLIMPNITIAENQKAFMEESEIYKITVNPEDVAISAPASINNGHVIAYGNYISPPYLVDMDDEGKIYINGVQYEPRLIRKDFKKISIKLEEPDEYTIAQHQLDILIHSKYKTLKKEYERIDIQNILLEFVTSQSIIDEAHFDEYGNLKVTYTDGSTEIMSFIDEEENKTKEIGVSQKEYFAQRDELKNIIISELQVGALIVFGFRATLTLPAGSANEVINQINKIKKDVMTKEEKIEQLRQIVIDKELVKEIYYNYQSK